MTNKAKNCSTAADYANKLRNIKAIRSFRRKAMDSFRRYVPYAYYPPGESDKFYDRMTEADLITYAHLPSVVKYFERRKKNIFTALPAHPKRGQPSEKYKAWVAEMDGCPAQTKPLKLKATLVVCPPTLCAQWYDEFEKFAPGLKVYVNHNSHKSHMNMLRRDDNVAVMCEADVIIQSSYGNRLNLGQLVVGRDDNWNSAKKELEYLDHLSRDYVYHRIIVDECQEVRSFSNEKYLTSSRRWAVTGTPVSKSFKELSKVAEWLGHSTTGLQLSKYFDASPNDNIDAFVANLRSLMIRHTKDQVIAGGAALTLPTLESETEYLTLSYRERTRYDAERKSALSRENIRTAQRSGLDVWPFMMALHQMLMICSNAATKINALTNDLRELIQKDPTAHALVFTQHPDTHRAIMTAVQALGVETLAVAGGMSMEKRHKAIRRFQEACESLKNGTAAALGVRPKVLVTTIKVGNCGITLTSATRVFMMEPCLDPGHEIQAAGRIHRLGQSSKCVVKRYCFKDCYEANVVKFHQRLKAGTAKMSNSFIPAKEARNLLR